MVHWLLLEVTTSFITTLTGKDGWLASLRPFQQYVSHISDGWMKIKGHVQWDPVYDWKALRLRQGLTRDRSISRRALTLLSYWNSSYRWGYYVATSASSVHTLGHWFDCFRSKHRIDDAQIDWGGGNEIEILDGRKMVQNNLACTYCWHNRPTIQIYWHNDSRSQLAHKVKWRRTDVDATWRRCTEVRSFDVMCLLGWRKTWDKASSSDTEVPVLDFSGITSSNLREMLK